jgi:hypothetical protein
MSATVQIGGTKMKLIVEKKDVWGQERFYPRCRVGEVLCDLMKKQTFCRTDIEKMKKVGFEFKLKQEEL